MTESIHVSIWKKRTLRYIKGFMLLRTKVGTDQTGWVKGALCRSGEEILGSLFIYLLYPQTNQINNLSFFLHYQTDLKGQPHTVLFSLFGGPCHHSSLKRCSGDTIFLSEQLVYSVMEKNRYFWVWIITSLILWILKLTQRFLCNNAREYRP